MADWTTQTDTQTDPDAPLTSTLAKSWYNNPIAIAENSVNSPYIQQEWHPYNSTAVGDANDGLFYDFAVHGLVASVETPNWVDGYEYMVSIVGVSGNNSIGGGSVNFQVEVYPETSAAYTAAVPLIEFSNVSTSIVGRVEFLGARLAQAMPFRSIMNSYAAPGITAGTRNDFISTNSVAQKHLKARFSFSVGSIDAGKMYLYRRKSFVK